VSLKNPRNKKYKEKNREKGPFPLEPGKSNKTNKKYKNKIAKGPLRSSLERKKKPSAEKKKRPSAREIRQKLLRAR
jgi:hypothetical protein